MQKNHRVLLGAVLIVSLGLFLYDIYAGLAGLIVFAAILMSVLMMEDSLGKPSLIATLQDDSKSLKMRNRGNAPARMIHVTVVPYNIEFDIPQLQVEEKFSYTFETMVPQAKVLVTYQNEQGTRFSKTFVLSALDKDEDDLLKPAFPLFSWKEEED
jgi:hypothetical protein